MTCDQITHDLLTASLDAFIDGTTHVGVQKLGDGQPPLLMGNCPRCLSTLCIAICEARGFVARGYIEGAIPERTPVGYALAIERPPADEDDDRIT